MGLWDKRKYGIMSCMKGGEPLTSDRTWLNKETALASIERTLEQGCFSWCCLLVFDLEGTLVGTEEYYQNKEQICLI